MEKRTPQQIAKDRATYVMDLVVAAPEEYQWSSTRETIAELVRMAGVVVRVSTAGGGGWAWWDP